MIPRPDEWAVDQPLEIRRGIGFDSYPIQHYSILTCLVRCHPHRFHESVADESRKVYRKAEEARALACSSSMEYAWSIRVSLTSLAALRC